MHITNPVTSKRTKWSGIEIRVILQKNYFSIDLKMHGMRQKAEPQVEENLEFT